MVGQGLSVTGQADSGRLLPYYDKNSFSIARSNGEKSYDRKPADVNPIQSDS